VLGAQVTIICDLFRKEINISPQRNNFKRNHFVGNHWQYTSYRVFGNSASTSSRQDIPERQVCVSWDAPDFVI
jgi:hypothetical protein